MHDASFLGRLEEQWIGKQMVEKYPGVQELPRYFVGKQKSFEHLSMVDVVAGILTRHLSNTMYSCSHLTAMLL